MRLILKSGPREGSTVEIDGSRLTIGRVPGNDLQLADQTVSREHAVIEVGADHSVVLRDLDSRNGTFVDDHRLSGACTLRGGELLRFGDERLLLERSAQRGGAPDTTGPAGGALEQSKPAAGAPERSQPAGDAPGPTAARSGARAGFAALQRPRALALLGVVVLSGLVFGVGQLLLPGVAEQRLRSQLSRDGVVRTVQIESVPAVKLLWHRADSVRVAMDSYRSNPTGPRGSLADFLNRTRDTARLDVSVGTLQSKLVTLHGVRLHKSGDQLLGQAELAQADLTAALPSFLNVRPVAASAEGIVLSASASALGQRVGIHLAVQASGGRLVVRPQGLPLASLATITVFSDPRIYVESLGAELHGETYLLTVHARLR
jgi:hypothetical protein